MPAISRADGFKFTFSAVAILRFFGRLPNSTEEVFERFRSIEVTGFLTGSKYYSDLENDFRNLRDGDEFEEASKLHRWPLCGKGIN